VEQDVVSVVVDWLKESANIIILTGPELSLESGIPDFSDTKFNPNIREFRENPDTREAYWEKIANIYPVLSKAKPNGAHNAVAQLEIICNVDYLFTGCTDGLHQKAGSASVVELMGSILWITCPNCGQDYKLDQMITQLQDGKKVPDCEVCSSDLIKSSISFPGQPLPHWELREAWMKLHNCDLFFIIGAYLDDSPLSSLQTIAAESGSKIVIVNERGSEADNYADAVIYGKPSMVISHIVDQIKKDITAS
jgi:NAD-dependent deacetylase